MTETHDDEIVHRELNSDREKPSIAIVEAIADLEGKQADELTPIYDCIDGMLSELYSNPPSPEAQMAVEFTYGGYRITVKQSGTADFIHVA
ncbi:HalOD1 output domain-containing protein [Halorubrum halophilum]|uniref:HalOD1 output domain-containing protein n=1 Tax=Halorubrum halophilum TaxID=413816 RepID=UPI000678E855|nr:HalOD1 output domain-containing protein [Halorubrum halophilum]